MNIPHPGELCHKIDIGTTFTVTNENGYPEESDSVLLRVWAGIEDSSSRWFSAADADQVSRGLFFIIRWNTLVQPGMWVSWQGTKYTITAVGEYDFKRRYMRLTAEAVKGVK